MTTISKEFITDTIEGLEQLVSRGIQSVYIDMAITGMHCLLASLEAEPVAWMFRQKAELREKFGTCDEWDLHHQSVDACFPSVQIPESDDYEFMPLYTSPPAPVSVPEVVLKSLLPDVEKSEFWFEHDGKILFEGVKFNNAVFDACQAAMLQGADGNSPVIPDGWVACSERLPEETKEPDGGATGYLVLYAEGKEPNGGFNVGVWNVTYLRQWWRGFITHWMPLPAAPQQETE